MKIESWIFGAGVFFFLPIAAVYGFLTDWNEWVGLMGLLLVGGLVGMIGAYLGFTGKRIGMRPEDRLDAEIHEGAGEQGHFSPWSWWPLVLGLACAAGFLGMAIGFWIVFIAAVCCGVCPPGPGPQHTVVSGLDLLRNWPTLGTWMKTESPAMGSDAARIAGEIDRDNGMPIHVQLREILRAHIGRSCPPGSALPSERDLAQRFGLARMTVRQAIDALVGEEVIERVVGLGTFVRKPKLDLQVKLTSYSEEMQRRGMVPAAKVLSFEQIGASPFLARELQLEEGTPLVRFRRLLLADNEPMSVDENFIPAHRVPGLLDGGPPTSLYNVLSERYGLVMEWGEDMIEATAASASTSRLLSVEIGSPLLKIQRHAFVARTMVDYSVSYYRADRYKLWVPLQRPGVRRAGNQASGYRP